LQHLIDGYNVIRGDARLREAERRGLECGRAALLRLVSLFAQRRRKHAFTVVFDRHNQPDGIETPNGAPSNVKSACAHSADDWLRLKVRNAKQPQELVVITDDRELGGACRQLGAAVWPAEKLLRLMRPEAKETPEKSNLRSAASEKAVYAQELLRHDLRTAKFSNAVQTYALRALEKHWADATANDLSAELRRSVPRDGLSDERIRLLDSLVRNVFSEFH
jgi:predicted RNA-binding protein with PIN domain